MEEKKHIEVSPDRFDGRPCIIGKDVEVQDMVLSIEVGQTPEDIINETPSITLADVHAALAYYYDYPTAINANIRRKFETDSDYKEKYRARILERPGTGLL